MFFSLRFWYLLLLSSKGQGKILKKNLRKFDAIKKIDKNEDWMEKNDAGMFEGDIMLEGGAKRAHLDTKATQMRTLRYTMQENITNGLSMGMASFHMSFPAISQKIKEKQFKEHLRSTMTRPA